MSHTLSLPQTIGSGLEQHYTERESANTETIPRHTPNTCRVTEEHTLFAPSEISLQANTPEKQNTQREQRDLHSQVPPDFFENLNRNTHRIRELLNKLELQVPPSLDFSDNTSPFPHLSPDTRSNCSVSQETSES